MNAILLGVLAGISLGVSDVFGRASALRASAVSHVGTAMLVGVFVATPFAIVLEARLITRDIVTGTLSGLVLAVGLAVVFRAMADSSSAIASPLAALIGVAVPLGWDLVGGATLSRTVAIGCGVAIVAVAITTYNPELGGRIRRGAGLAVIAGVLFGLAIVLVADTSADSGAWPAVAQRASGALGMAALASVWKLPIWLPRPVIRFGLYGGLAGGLGMVFWVLGAQQGDLGTVSVAASTYPTVTVLLAARFDGDTLRWWQLLGVIGTVVGTGMIAVG